MSEIYSCRQETPVKCPPNARPKSVPQTEWQSTHFVSIDLYVELDGLVYFQPDYVCPFTTLQTWHVTFRTTLGHSVARFLPMGECSKGRLDMLVLYSSIVESMS